MAGSCAGADARSAGGYGVNVSAFPAFQALHEGETFTRIEKFIPDASSRFSFANQRLTLSIPRRR